MKRGEEVKSVREESAALEYAAFYLLSARGTKM